MARPLVVIAVAGIATSAICLALAGALGPYRGWSYPYMSPPYSVRGWWGHPPWGRLAPFTESGPVVTRDFDWDGAEELEMAIPGVVTYATAPTWRVTVTGRESSVDRLRIGGGRIGFDEQTGFPLHSSIQVRISGPALSHVVIDGSGQLVLENVAQQSLAIDLRGNGSVQGRGTTGSLDLRIFGSADARLGGLATGDLDASIYGSGNADVAPTGDVKVNIFGSGDVRLHARPRSVSTRSFGSGRVVQVDGELPATPGVPPGTGGSAAPEEVAI